MANAFAALLFRPDQVPDRALSRGFAVALAGWDLDSPRLLIAPLRGIDGWSIAFYQSGLRSAQHGPFEEFEHAVELFEEELSPGQCVWDAASEMGSAGTVLYSLVYTDESVHDDVVRFDASGIRRWCVIEGEEGIEAAEEVEGKVKTHLVRLPATDEMTEAQENAAIEKALRPYRGSTYLSAELQAPVLGPVVAAFFDPERRINVRLVEPTPESIVEQVRALNRVLHRQEGRGAFRASIKVQGVMAPDPYRAFVEAYDWNDPSDPGDLYRELSIGAIEGTLHFLRPTELEALDSDSSWASAAKAGLFPIATLRRSTLNGSRSIDGTVALASDGDTLLLVTQRTPQGTVAGPTFGELLNYLALGWNKARTDPQEDLIGALMLKAKMRSAKRHS